MSTADPAPVLKECEEGGQLEEEDAFVQLACDRLWMAWKEHRRQMDLAGIKPFADGAKVFCYQVCDLEHGHVQPVGPHRLLLFR